MKNGDGQSLVIAHLQALRSQCSRQKRGGCIEKSAYYSVVEKQEDLGKKQLLRRRKEIVEPVFAHVKEHGGFRRFTFRGLENVRAQWAMVCTAFNLKKLYRYWQREALEMSWCG